MNTMPQKTNEIKFRTAKTEELSIIIDLFSKSFLNDPLMALFNPNPKKQKIFINSLFALITKGYYYTHTCLVAIKQNEIIAAALVKKKDVPELNFFSYARFGGWKLVKCLGLKKFIRFLSIYNQALIDCKNLDENSWYLEAITVRQDFQRQHIGSMMLQECIIPYIKKNNGGLLTLITQKESNYNFYTKNGFINFSNTILGNGKDKINNFSFKQEIIAK